MVLLSLVVFFFVLAPASIYLIGWAADRLSRKRAARLATSAVAPIDPAATPVP